MASEKLQDRCQTLNDGYVSSMASEGLIPDEGLTATGTEVGTDGFKGGTPQGDPEIEGPSAKEGQNPAGKPEKAAEADDPARRVNKKCEVKSRSNGVGLHAAFRSLPDLAEACKRYFDDDEDLKEPKEWLLLNGRAKGGSSKPCHHHRHRCQGRSRLGRHNPVRTKLDTGGSKGTTATSTIRYSRIFKKTSLDGNLTLFLPQRDLTITESGVEPLIGVAMVHDSIIAQSASLKVYLQIILVFR